MTEDPAMRARLLTFVIVGGGPTGVETAAEMNEFIHGIIDRYCNKENMCGHDEIKTVIIHSGSELMQQFHSSLRTVAENRLRSKGVELHLNSTVVSVTAQGLVVKNGAPDAKDVETIPASTIIWAAGVKPVIPDFVNMQDSISSQPAQIGGRLEINDFFQLVGHERVFALGDIAAPLPMLAQVAVGESKVVAENLLNAIQGKPLRKFAYNSKGSLVSIGQWSAVGEIFSHNYAGWLVWWLWRTTYLFKFASWKKRIRIAFEWTMQIFYPRDITKLT